MLAPALITPFPLACCFQQLQRMGVNGTAKGQKDHIIIEQKLGSSISRFLLLLLKCWPIIVNYLPKNPRELTCHSQRDP